MGLKSRVHTHLYSLPYLLSWVLLFPHPPNIAVLPIYITEQWCIFKFDQRAHLKKRRGVDYILLPRMQFPHIQSTNACFVGILLNTIHLYMILGGVIYNILLLITSYQPSTQCLFFTLEYTLDTTAYISAAFS